MVITDAVKLPSDAELTTAEVNLSGAALRAGAFHLGKSCEKENNEYMLCRHELDDPRKCLQEGKDVTNCALNFFRKVKTSCHEEFQQYANCLDKSSPDFQFNKCRNTQGVYDKCVFDNIGIERPDYGYFCRAKVHDSKRPEPAKPKLTVYEDATPGLPDDFPREPAKHGARFHWLN